MADANPRRRSVAARFSRYVHTILAVGALALTGLGATAAQASLQCVPYVREVSGIEIYGNARTWWDQADGRYSRGQDPAVGAVIAFAPTDAMPFGHVAVVEAIIDDRQILLDHANWSGPGVIDHHALAVDVSEAGDWSSVRVWYGPSGSLGSRHNPIFGFIYNAPPARLAPPTLQLADSASASHAATPAG